MSDMPERIWAWQNYGRYWSVVRRPQSQAEYIRVDAVMDELRKRCGIDPPEATTAEGARIYRGMVKWLVSGLQATECRAGRCARCSNRGPRDKALTEVESLRAQNNELGKKAHALLNETIALRAEVARLKEEHGKHD